MLHHPMRRKKNEITAPAQMHAMIQASPVMRLALCRENEPYVVPMSFGFNGESIFFHSAPEGLKIDILRNNPRVCCLFEHGLAFETKGDNPCAWGFSYATVIVHGLACPITNPQDKLAALQCITDHYAGQTASVPPDKTGGVDVWRIQILEMTGKRAG
jgi:nitroimidazol reductase NimA-like FMN-containing flavoprotein (pyridoxamine 5'-phosphate oxidase superfamily)